MNQNFELRESKMAVKYYKVAMKTNDELYGITNVLKLQRVVFEEQEKQRKAELEQINTKNRLKQYALLSGLGVLFLIGFILYRNYQNQKKVNAELNRSLSQLKSTQAQLIQKEKLASLGELTAGIAHEIQNPLNFVNNFSELSIELMEELQQEAPIGQGSLSTLGAELLADISQNLEKINHHGKRASSIVKGMLEHSRQATGERQLTDINKLADEYLRLAYHGLRAKNQDFDCELITDFDPNLPQIEVIPQDIGRVFVNLINNAFYAVNQRFRSLQGDKVAYLPKVTIKTFKIESTNEAVSGGLGVSIRDNGAGIPEAIKSKIFQPFFTTKPTGEGTGLGLSLAYDIITKGHGGTIECESVEGEGTTFTVKFPLKTS